MQHFTGTLKTSVLAATLFGIAALTLGTAELRMTDTAKTPTTLSGSASPRTGPENDLGWG
ncbi:hypothetical protein [Streptomyces sp. NPDC002785]|uniref:hypothetical protein n=1 Tax=Streptomyces sp. NPDC002785 TaxID=3154543 RepID=UPI0033286856